MREDVLILYSGGADSRLMLEFAKISNLEPYCLVIDYEQLHQDELKCAEKQLESMVEFISDWHIININYLNINSGLTGKGDKNNTGEVHEMHMPGRNTIFLSCAFSVAESRDIDTIWIGCDWSDAINKFPDCTQEYLLQLNETFKYAGPKPIKVEAPILGLSKEMVLSTLKGLGISEDELYSGYGDL